MVRRISGVMKTEVHIHFADVPQLLAVGVSILQKLTDISHTLATMETKMATVDDLNAAAAAMQGTMSANDARVATLAHAVSEAAANDAAHDAALDAEIKRLNDLLAAGGDPAALQAVVDSLTAMSAEGVAQGAAIDDATTALAAAFPAPAPTP